MEARVMSQADMDRIRDDLATMKRVTGCHVVGRRYRHWRPVHGGDPGLAASITK